jgi:hypothetical protein
LFETKRKRILLKKDKKLIARNSSWLKFLGLTRSSVNCNAIGGHSATWGFAFSLIQLCNTPSPRLGKKRIRIRMERIKNAVIYFTKKHRGAWVLRDKP